mmetsp:Transcript_115073/g.245835  ORF Transcript_115073/g.245835 Transcript_115073/m.245835 type:complete len:764 (-) Transcript_115073:91-2382(-)
MALELKPISLPEARPLEDGSGAFPLTLSPHGEAATPGALASWCSRHCNELRALTLAHGAVLFRGCGIEGADAFAGVTRSLGCEGYEYVGGAAPRTEIVPGVVFTSNESPPDQPIPFHHELAQAQVPPEYVLFFCEREAASGGATPIIPSAEVASFFEREFPDFARKVEELGVRYIRVMPEVTDMSSAQGRSWKETYNVASREEAEEAMRKQGTTWEWLPSGDCRTTTAILPALRTNKRNGRHTFFNSIIAAFTGWNDARNVGERAVVLGDGSPVDGAALHAVARFMQERRVAFQWRQGDVLLIDNTLVMHSRDTFVPGVPPRRVLAALRGPPILGAAEQEAGNRAAPLRVGIIGTGAMGKEHIRNIALLGTDVARVIAIADSDARGRAEAIQDLGPWLASSCAVFERYEDLIDCDFVDALVVCTPNYTHIDVLRRGIPTGKHILCEKPLCTTVEDCEEVERLLEERDARAKAAGQKVGVFMTGMEYRWMPPIAQLIEETDSGKHGPVHTVAIREHRFPFLVKVNNWNRFNRYTGGTLVEKAVHFFDLMRRIVHSEPVSVYASGGQAINHKDELFEEGSPDILDHAFAVVEFENGARASLDLCMFAEDEQTEQVTTVCEKAKIEAKAPDSMVRVVRRRHIATPGRTPPAPSDRAVPEVRLLQVPEDLAKAGYHEGATFFELRAFCEAVRGERPVPVTVRDGRLAVAMGAAAHESIRTGAVVQMGSSRASTDAKAGSHAYVLPASPATNLVPAATRSDGVPPSRL